MLLTGLPELGKLAWEETRYVTYHPENPYYSPKWEAYQQMEDDYRLRFVSMRDSEQLIGYAAIFITDNTQNSTITRAQYRDFYIIPGKRGYASRFMSFIERHTKELGIKHMRIGEQVKGIVRPGLFYEARGYQLEERIYGKQL